MNILRASSTFRIAIVLFVSLIFVGCGSGGGSNNSSALDNFVFTGNNGQTAGGNSSLTFNFVRAQTSLNVPLDTATLRFRFYSDTNGGGVLLQEVTRDFANSITIDNVNNATESVIVTAFNGDGFPVFQGTVPTSLVVGGDSTVDFATATTQNVSITGLLVTPDTANVAAGGTQQFTANLSFSNGDILPANNVVWTATGQGSVDVNTGLFTATTDGVASVTGTRDAFNDTSSIIVGAGPVLTTLTVAPDNQTIGTGSDLQFSVTGLDQNGVAFAPITGVVWSVTGTATIDADTGLLMAPNEENVVVTATVGAVNDSTNLTILNSVPTIMFGNTAQIDFFSTQSPNIADAMDVTVTDDMANLDGGTLLFSLNTPGTIFDATFNVGGPNIGTILGNNTNSVLINLNTNATPANIAAVVESTTISFGGTGGTGTLQVSLTDAQNNSAVPETRPFSVPDPVPVVTLDGGLLSFQAGEFPLISPAGTVTDDLTDLNGGTLAFSISGTASDAAITIPAAPAIGMINNNGTNMASVTLDANATPANLTTVLQGVLITGGPTKGTGTIQVDLSDTDGNNAVPVTRDFEHLALSVTVGATGDFATIQAAVDSIGMTFNAQGSTITALADYAFINEIVNVGDIDSLDGLTIVGQAAGVSAGVTPGIPPGLTTVDQLDISADGVTLDGLDFSNSTGTGSNIGGMGTTIQNCFCFGNGAGIGIFSFDPNLTILNSNFQNWDNGVGSILGGGTYTGNAFQGNFITGLAFAGTTGAEVITGNGFSLNASGHLTSNGTVDITVSGNDFHNNGGAVATFNTGGINAQGNWWGADADPVNPAQVDDGAGANGAIDFSNRLNVDPFPAFP